MRTSFVSAPNAPAFPCTAPPTVPGTVAIHSRPRIPLRAATAATLAIGVPDDAVIVVSSIDVSAQSFCRTTPLMPASATSRFVPPPRTKTSSSCSRATATAPMRSRSDVTRT